MSDMCVANVDSSENVFDPSSLRQLLGVYYKRLFPYSLYYKWLRYNDEKNVQFSHREFSFTLEGDIYLRYQSFTDEAEMRSAIRDKTPYKIDIGAVYSFRPREQRTVSSFHPVEKELVFDIDMTDYDEVRTCCSGADICEKCWPFMTVAMKILDRALREDFGFNQLLWVYSGRRGVHCWVCDETARQLSPAARSAIVEYLSLVKGGEFQSKKVYFPDTLHPSIKAASKIIERYFENLMLENQDILGTTENCEKIASLCTDPKVKEMILSDMKRHNTSKERWQVFTNVVDCALESKGAKNKHFIKEVMFQLCYPRLDVNVSKGLNHLLKAPFCVHPKTGRVCIPIDIKNTDNFDPFSVPAINTLCEEIFAYDAKAKNEASEVEEVSQASKAEDLCKTSLTKSLRIFREFVFKLNKASKNA